MGGFQAVAELPDDSPKVGDELLLAFENTLLLGGEGLEGLDQSGWNGPGSFKLG